MTSLKIFINIFLLRFRLMAFDSGLFSFKDFTLSKNGENSLFTLITNPKNILAKARHEKLNKINHSSHIRFLVFAKNQIKSAKVWIDDVLIGNAKLVDDKSVPLFTIPWNPDEFKSGVHHIKVIVEVILNLKD